MTLDEFIEFVTERTGFLVAGAELSESGTSTCIWFETDDQVTEEGEA